MYKRRRPWEVTFIELISATYTRRHAFRKSHLIVLLYIQPSNMNPLRPAACFLPLARTTVNATRSAVHKPLFTTTLRPQHQRLHTTPPDQTWPQSPTSPEPRVHPNTENKPAPGESIGDKRFADFDLAGKVFIVTGGAQGLGLAMAEALVEAGGRGMYSLSLFPQSYFLTSNDTD